MMRPAAMPNITNYGFLTQDFSTAFCAGAKSARGRSNLLYLLNRNEKNITYQINHSLRNFVLRDCSANRCYQRSESTKLGRTAIVQLGKSPKRHLDADASCEDKRRYPDADASCRGKRRCVNANASFGVSEDVQIPRHSPR